MKAIYAKRIKELLERKYDIFPIGTIPNPKNPYYTVWIYNTTDALSFALDQIMEGKQNGSNGEG